MPLPVVSVPVPSSVVLTVPAMSTPVPTVVLRPARFAAKSRRRDSGDTEPGDFSAPFGPLPVKAQDTFAGLAFTLDPESAAVLLRNRTRFHARIDIGNNLMYLGPDVDRTLLSDCELTSFRAGYVVGIGRGAEVSAQITAQTRGGGVLDPLLRFWHRAIVPYEEPSLGTPPDGRTVVQATSFGQSVEIFDSKSAISSVSLGYKKLVTANFSWRASVKLPINGSSAIADARSDYLDNGAIDIAVGALYSGRARGRLHVHGNLNVVYAGTTTVGALTRGRRVLVGGIGALEYALDAKTSGVVQFEDIAFPFLADHPGAERRQSMSFGLQRKFGTALWHLSFSENVYPLRFTGYSPDFQLSFGVAVRG